MVADGGELHGHIFSSLALCTGRRGRNVIQPTSLAHQSRCPLWLKGRHSTGSERCPLYPQKRTLELSRAMSALCQKRTLIDGVDRFASVGVWRAPSWARGLVGATMCLAYLQ